MTTVILRIIDSYSQFRKKKVLFLRIMMLKMSLQQQRNMNWCLKIHPRMFNFLLFNYVNHLIIIIIFLSEKSLENQNF